jgi:hypothetical protein
MHQESFNLTHPVSHSHDPDTSKAAERSITDSGKRKSNNQRVAWLVARYPGKTASELEIHAMREFYHSKQLNPLGATTDKRLFEIRRRLSDMNGIHVQRGTKDQARIGLLKNKESVWFPRGAMFL